MNAKEIKGLLKAKGWSSVDVAAYWGLGVQYLSWIIGSNKRGVQYECAFRGLPDRASVEVKREERHKRKNVKKWFTEINPVGRILQATCSRYVEEGDRLVVVETTFTPTMKKGTALISLRAVSDTSEDPYIFTLPDEEVSLRFADIGLSI